MEEKNEAASTQAARTLTPDPRHVEAAREPRANFVALRLRFRYGLEQESAPRQHPEITETLALLFPADMTQERQIQAMEAALRAGGARLPSAGLAGSWSGVEAAGRQWTTASTTIGSGQSEHWTVESEEAGIEAFADKAREIGRQAAAAGGAVAWRRVDDVAGAKSMMHGLEMISEEFEALGEARALSASVAKAAAPAKKPAL